MIEIRNKFKQYCIDLFGEEDGTLIYSFYNKFFSYSLYKKEGVEKTLTFENKISNITHILNISNKDNFLACIRKFKRDWEKGIVKTHSLRYFTAAAEKYKETSKDIELTKSEKSNTPTQYKKTRTDNPSDFYNWDYKCSCGEIVQPWLMTCPKCNISFDWSKLFS